MKLSLYGLPCSGKTHILNKINSLEKQDCIILNGSQELNNLSNGTFADLPEHKQNDIRILYTQYIENLNKHDNLIISDGHYSFNEEIVFTSDDGKLYDTFIYLYKNPEIIKHRISKSTKNNKFSDYSVETIKKWQDFEINSLRDYCHEENKDFYIIDDENVDNIIDFIDEIRNGFSAYQLAKCIFNQIVDIYPNEKYKDIVLVDGDKTIIKQDSFRHCCNGKTNVFDGNFYTSYQSYLFRKEVGGLVLDTKINSKINSLELNDEIFSRVENTNYIVLSSGITELWNEIKKKFEFENVIANQLISAETKYFIAKLLQEKGYNIVAYGDSKVDIYMLEVAKNGYLYINEKISNSLKNTAINVNIIQNLSPIILSNENNSENLQNNISICKSNSGISGSKLANAHLELGGMIGEKLKESISNENVCILVLERGGRFFGDGLYLNFGGNFYPFNPNKEDLPRIKESTVVIVDSVINTGKSLISIIEELEKNKDNNIKNIIIVSNVIQSKAITYLKDYKVFAIRISDNFFIGKKQTFQSNSFGPDTADRLFNLI